MDKYRKILVAILALFVLSAVIAIVDISMKMQKKDGSPYGAAVPAVGPGVAVVRIEGPIFMIGPRGLFSMPSDAESIIKRLSRIELSRNIKAVVLRINSPGGSVVATQEIYQKLWRLRKKNIILVASMGEIAASGGYYVASACNHIVANHGTLTGSIGVIARSPNVKGLFDKLGVRMNIIKSGKYKDALSPYRNTTEDEIRFIREMIESSHKKFIKDIALGRNMNQSEIVPYADGRIINGVQAREYKLVDTIGTFEDAVDTARSLAKLPEDAPVYDETKTPIQQFIMNMEGLVNGFRTVGKGMVPDNLYLLEYRAVP